MNKCFIISIKQTNKQKKKEEEIDVHIIVLMIYFFHCLKNLFFFFDVIFNNSGMRISDTHDVRVIKINHLKGLNAPIVVVV